MTIFWQLSTRPTFGFFRYIYLYRQYIVAGFIRSEDDVLKVFNTSIQGQSPWSLWSSCSSWYIIMVYLQMCMDFGQHRQGPICTSLKSLNYHQLYYISLRCNDLNAPERTYKSVHILNCTILKSQPQIKYFTSQFTGEKFQNRHSFLTSACQEI